MLGLLMSTHVNFLDIILLTMFITVLLGLIRSTNLRYKFFFFLMLLALITVWGMCASFDVFLLFFLLTEFLVIVLFLIINVTFSFVTYLKTINKRLHYFFGITPFIIYFSDPLFTYWGFFSYTYQLIYTLIFDVISNDLFMFYYFIFIDFSLCTIYLTLILSFFSIIFIWIYFSFLKINKGLVDNPVCYEGLRKQRLAKQRFFLTSIRLFSK